MKASMACCDDEFVAADPGDQNSSNFMAQDHCVSICLVMIVPPSDSAAGIEKDNSRIMALISRMTGRTESPDPFPPRTA